MSEEWKPDYNVTPAWVVCAALFHPETGRIITGPRHFCPTMRQQILASEGFPFWKTGAVTQGFVDQFGAFLTRKDAWIIAERNGQIKREVSSPGTLYSENLY